MVHSCIRTGLVAGLVAGLLAGAFGLLVGSPSLEQAIALEEAAAEGNAHGEGLARWTQHVGLVAGTVVVGVAIGAVFGLAFAWSLGRLGGHAWTRSLKLGGVLLGALVVLPALVQPPIPPGVGDPRTVTVRTMAWVGAVVGGLLLPAAAWTGARRLRERTRLGQPARKALIATFLAAGVLVFTRVVAQPAGPASLPADVLWSFRLTALATQVVLYGGVAVIFGLLRARAEGPASMLR